MIPTHLLGFDGALCGKIPTKAIPAAHYHKLRAGIRMEPEPPVCGWCTLAYSAHNERIQDAIQQETNEALHILRGND